MTKKRKKKKKDLSNWHDTASLCSNIYLKARLVQKTWIPDYKKENKEPFKAERERVFQFSKTDVDWLNDGSPPKSDLTLSNFENPQFWRVPPSPMTFLVKFGRDLPILAANPIKSDRDLMRS